jgi:predicted RNA-binding protein with TRAM domain
MTDPTPAPHAHAHLEGKWRTVALILLPIVGILLVIVAIYLVRPRDPGVVTVVYTDGQAGAGDINIGAVIDATDPRAAIEPRLGYRYKVFVEDESEDRTSGIAKIGGRVTFVPNARRGQTALVDVTRVRERVTDAVLVRVLSEITMPPKAVAAPFEPKPGDSAGHVVAGAEMDVIISEASSQNPETEGIAKVGGLVVVVQGVSTIGERVHVRINDRRERIAFAEPTGQPPGTDPLPMSAAPARRGFQPRSGDSAAHVVAGAELDVVISEASSKNPGLEGIAKVEGLVVVVQGVSTIGERVHVRITDRRDRIAFAEPTGKPAGTDPLPTSVKPVQRVFQPGYGDPAAHVVPGAEMDVVIAEASGQKPGIDGVARIKGLVVFVEGVPTIGETVHVRITDRRERAANAVPTGKPAGSGGAPATGDVIRRAFTPGTTSGTAEHVVAGAELDLEIIELSKKNPGTEGVAKVDGLIVFVEGGTTVGETVRARITARRERMAFAEVVAAPAP